MIKIKELTRKNTRLIIGERNFFNFDFKEYMLYFLFIILIQFNSSQFGFN